MNLKSVARRSLLAAAVCSCVAGRRCRRMAQQNTLKRRAALQPGGPRPDLDHRLHEPQPRLHDLRHPVRHRRERQDQAADGREAGPRAPDKRLWTFKLRKGLEFHDGKPVTGEDVIASPAALGQARRDGLGADAVRRPGWTSPTPDTFRIFLGEAYGFMLEALGKPSSNVPFIMPKRIAETDAVQADRGAHRLGPLHLQARRVQARRQGGLPEEHQVRAAQRAAVSGTTGGKVVYVDRVEWNLALRDAQAAGQRAAEGRGRHHRGARLRPLRGASRPTRASRCSKYATTACSTWRASTTCTSPSTTRRCARR